MELTGFAGKLIGLAILIVGYSSIMIGLVYFFNYLIQEIVIMRILKQFRLYQLLILFVIDHYKKKADIKDNEE